MWLITTRVNRAGSGMSAGTTKGHCSDCGAEVYASAAAQKLLREYDMLIICTVCYAPQARSGVGADTTK